MIATVFYKFIFLITLLLYLSDKNATPVIHGNHKMLKPAYILLMTILI